MPLDRDRIAHYRLVRMVGAGAMGEVYEAVDEHLNRRVAVKVISSAASSHPEIRQRFLREAHAASAFTHPNIAHIYGAGSDDGIDYIAMEYIDGETLVHRLARGGMAIDDIVDVVLQLADALAAAHDHGVVHRDVKPANVMIDARGQVKMLDFGLARIEAAPVTLQEDTLDQRSSTNPGTILGTTSYMSPEQALGEAAAAASDVFSIGVVLYEMIAGRLPFAGKTTADTLHRLTALEPEPLARFNYDLPAELERIVRKCLEKTAARRYRSAGELLVDLKALARDRSSGSRLAPRWAAPPPRTRRAIVLVAAAVVAVIAIGAFLRRATPSAGSAEVPRSIAVLPFNIAGMSDSEYVADGITESLINALAEDPRIHVMARSTVFHFKGSALTPQQVGRALSVDAIVTADLQPHGDRLTLAAELVSTADGARLWGDRYERAASDIIGIQDDLIGGIGRALRLQHAPRGEQAPEAGRAEAHRLYLHAQRALNERTRASIVSAAQDLRRAIATDPSYALPYAALADTFTLSARYAGMATADLSARARDAAMKALQFGPSLPEAHVAMASVYDTCDWNWAAAEKEYQKAIALRPGDVLAHQWYALLLARLGRRAEAEREKQLALSLDPLSALLHLFAANIDYYAGRFDAAANSCAKAIDLDPRVPLGQVQYALILMQQGRYRDARTALESSGSRYETVAARGVLDALEGNTAAAGNALSSLSAGGADYEAAVVAATLHRDDLAFQSLERACAKHDVYAGYAKVDPLLTRLHGDRRFLAVLRRAGLS
jgi:serine/threonine protein kinase/Tfp pilus assembly protein PilF